MTLFCVANIFHPEFEVQNFATLPMKSPDCPDTAGSRQGQLTVILSLLTQCDARHFNFFNLSHSYNFGVVSSVPGLPIIGRQDTEMVS